METWTVEELCEFWSEIAFEVTLILLFWKILEKLKKHLPTGNIFTVSNEEVISNLPQRNDIIRNKKPDTKSAPSAEPQKFLKDLKIRTPYGRTLNGNVF